MKILALEFSSPQRSVALVDGGTTLVASAVETMPHRMNALGMVDQVLREAHWEREAVECIVVGLGPGSYTGIRAAIALAQGWQLARDIRLLGISSVEALAVEAQTRCCLGSVHIVIDAQRREFYYAQYQISSHSLELLVPLRIVTWDDLMSRASQGGAVIGPEADQWFPEAHRLFPQAVHLGRLATQRQDFVPGFQLTPIYLRETQFVKAPPPRVLPRPH